MEESVRAFHGEGMHGNGGTNRNDTWQHHHSLKMVTDFRLSGDCINWIIWGKPLEDAMKCLECCL